MNQKIVNIDPLSASSLFIELCFNDQVLAKATSFIVLRKGKHYLLTNRHNVTGRDQNTGKELDKVHASIPNIMKVYYNLTDSVGGNRIYEHVLVNDEGICWYEHPSLKERADFVALPVPTNDKLLSTSPCYDLDAPEIDVLLKPGDRANIIGFPFAKKTMNNFGIWITGFLASDIDIDIDNEPKFYIDARTRTGQSGSPVVFYRNGESVKLINNNTMLSFSGHKLLGIYCGRINDDSDIGVVWKREAICELLDSIEI